MLRRRLIFLLILLILAMGIITARLAVLQIVRAKYWKDQARSFNYRHFIIPTRRGSIVDRRGRYLAVEAPCYNLAIEYQAMNMDDPWITRQAIRRLKIRYHTRAAILAHLPAQRRRIARELRREPAAVARHCGRPLARVLERFDVIRARMQLLREDVWTMRYSRHNAVEADESPRTIDMRLGLANPVDLAEAHEAHTIIPNIPPAVAFYFKKHADRYPGLVVEAGTHRVYPYGGVAAQVVGVLRQVTPAALAKDPFVLPRLIPGTLRDTKGNLKGYLPGDSMGASGVELAAENLLRGVRGVKLVNLDGREIMRDRRAPIPGKTIHLTLDINLQQTLQKALLDPARHLLNFKGWMHNAAVVVLSVKHNRVLVMLSEPGYNANAFHRKFEQLVHDPRLPLVNRAVAATYPPGSVVKPIEASLAMTDGVITPQTVINCGAYLFPGHPGIFHNWTFPYAPGPLTLVGALEQSCDTYFYQVGMRLGFKRLVAGYREFGLGRPTGVGLPEDSGGSLPRVHGKGTSLADQTNAIFLGIGQGPITLTPLQLANAYTALLRGGIWMAPQLIEEFPRPPPRRIKLEAADMGYIWRGMYQVVHGSKGTAPVLRMNIPVAGKTGTAQTRQLLRKNGKMTLVKGDDAWFVGDVPANDPKYVIAAVVPMGGDGGRRAGPIVRQCILDMEQNGYLPKLDTP